MTAARDSQKSYDNIGGEYVTFVADGSTITFDSTLAGGSAEVGRAVKLSTDDVVALVGDGEKVKGKLLLVEPDLRCNVQVEGFCLLPAGDSATLTIGGTIVGATRSSVGGYIKAATTTGVAVGSIINNDDVNNVVVDL